MHKSFKAISLSYGKAPIEIRELVALDESACLKLLRYFKEFTDYTDVMVLSTCNRTEVYYSSEVDQSETIIKLIGIQKNVKDIERFRAYFDVYTVHEEAIDHLFAVSMGLEAQVVGDMQISNQVKRAYQWSANEFLAGPFLHRLMHTIFFTNKKVVQETSYRDGAASVSYAAAELVMELTNDIINPRILIIGLGEIGADVCRNLSGSKPKQVYITNRTLSKAEALSEECGFEILPFEDVYDAIASADVIISSVAGSKPFITKALVKEMNIVSYKYFIDLSVPRSIETEVEELPGALIYNIDDIKDKASEALEKRIAAIPQVKKIIDEAMTEFHDWSKEMVVSPTIQKLKGALEQIRQEEMNKYMKSLNDVESQKVDKITRGMMQKILRLPVLQLKAACKKGDAETLIDVLNELFNLENQVASEE